MSSEYYLSHKKNWGEFYLKGLRTCPHAKMLRSWGMSCPFFSCCMRADRGKYPECGR